eukprot:c9059_g1_i1.p1 GENE.c9059_g1_i1~~c9059_g1_i1.p1  ORF type:complete len:1126 (+),score=277.61 c9059_g1_i1:42-3380(+)
MVRVHVVAVFLACAIVGVASFTRHAHAHARHSSFIAQAVTDDPTLNAYLRCPTWPGGAIGSPIDCTWACSIVCNGTDNCPCNEGQTSACWVPTKSAKAYCALIKNCHVISDYSGAASLGLPHYGEWSHLGSYPVVAKKSWTASVCDKETEPGCFECGNRYCPNDEQRKLCYLDSKHPLQYYAPQYGFCGIETSQGHCWNAADAGCCSFKPNSYCVANSSCLPAPQLCSSRVIEAINQVNPQTKTCSIWLRKVLTRIRPSLDETCACMSAIRKHLDEADMSLFDCAIIPRTFSVKSMLTMCPVEARCHETDACGGCSVFRPSLSVGWVPLEHAQGSSKHCGVDPDTHSCKLTMPDNSLTALPCSTFEQSAQHSEWFWAAEPAFASPPLVYKDSDIITDGSLPAPSASPMPPRRDPVPAKKVAPSPIPSASPTAFPKPQDINFDEITIGEAIEHRHYFDNTDHVINFVMPCTQMPQNGAIQKWSVYAAHEGRVHAQILRPAALPADLLVNPDPIMAFTVVGENILHIPHLGNFTFEIPKEQQINVTQGDVIGFYSQGGILSWSEGGEKVLWRYGSPRSPTLAFPVMLDTRKYQSGETLLFVGEGAERTYSIAITGNFPGHEGYVPSESSSRTPSVSSSVSPSVSPSPSESASSSESASPSASPSLTSRSPCAEGVSYWCASHARMVECSVPDAVWSRLCNADASVLSASSSDTPALADSSVTSNADDSSSATTSTESESSATTSTSSDSSAASLETGTDTNTNTNTNANANANINGDSNSNIFSHSNSSTHSPPPQNCDPYRICPAGQIPRDQPVECFVADSDCVASPCRGADCTRWEHDNVAKFGNVSCPYCMGGQDWTGLCVKGKSQSPIKVTWDKVDVDTHTPLSLNTHYNTAMAHLEKAGYAHVIKGYFGSIELDHVFFDANTVTLHSPAEHRVQGVPRSPLEVQITHQRRHGDKGDNTRVVGETLIVSVFFDEAGHDEEETSYSFSKLLDRYFHRNTSMVSSSLNLNEVVNDHSPVVLYEGSLTVPPCSEGVLWALVMGDNAKLAKDKLARLDSLYKNNHSFANGRGNNRDPQPLGNRKLTLKTNCGKGTGGPCPRAFAPSADDSVLAE